MKFKIILVLAILFSIAIVAGSIYTKKLIDELPSISNLENYTPSIVTKIFDRNENLITELFMERRVLVPLKDIPLDLQNAFLATEDNDFYNHWGISTKGILRAFIKNLIKGKVSQGGSTITQQLSKAIFLTSERTLKRKIKEVLLTIQLERQHTKEEILQLYINQIYFGAGGYGAESASRVYFGKSVKDLNLAESAMIAALPKAPNYYSPLKNPERATKRRALVLSRMKELGYITEEQEQEANATPVPTEKHTQEQAAAHYFVEYLRILLEPKYGTNVLHKGGLTIYTTLDMKMQEAAEKALTEALNNFDKERIETYKKQGKKFKKVQGAIMAIDPKTGAIRVMVGGRDFKETKFNRAVQAKRQAGSSFKPFVYTAAIDTRQITPATQLEDEQLVYMFNGKKWELSSGKSSKGNSSNIEILAEKMTAKDLLDPMKVWHPVNYDRRYRGSVTVRKAIEKSLNVCAVEVIDKVGSEKVIDYARKMGIKSPLTNTLSLSLGASDVTLQEMVSAFGTLASGGVRTEPYFITKVIDKDGKVLEYNLPLEKEVLSPQTSFVMTNLLQGVVRNGSGYAATQLERPCAGKTGTSNDNIDAWFIGYTPQLVAGVWVGYDDRTTLGSNITGGKIACPIWTTFMKEALKGYPKVDFAQPTSGIEWALIDPKTGLLALSKTKNAYLEAFLEGTAPVLYCTQKNLYDDEESDEQSETEEEQQTPETPEVEDGF